MSLKVRLEVSPLATTQISGVGHYTQLLGAALAYDKNINFSGFYFDFLNRQSISSVTYKNKLVKNSFFPLRVYAKLQSYGIAPAFDILLPKVDLTIFPNFATWPSFQSRKRATVIHDLTYLHFPDAVEAKNLAHLQRVVPRSIQQADFVITVSETIKEELVTAFRLNPEKCLVTPIPPDESFFQSCSIDTIKKVKAKYGLNMDKEYIYFIGNREPRKNLTVLIQAYERLPEDIRRVYSLVIAGGKGWKSNESNNIIDRAVKNGTDIQTIGYIDQEDSPALYQGARLFVMPSLYEGFGMPIMEAYASGCPVVASDISVLREVGGEMALYADPKSPDSFAHSIQQALITTPPTLTSLQSSARRFSWAQNVQNIINKTNSIL